jgi:hypothetical protein
MNDERERLGPSAAKREPPVPAARCSNPHSG